MGTSFLQDSGCKSIYINITEQPSSYTIKKMKRGSNMWGPIVCGILIVVFIIVASLNKAEGIDDNTK